MSEFFIGQVSEHAVLVDDAGRVLLLQHAGCGNAALRGKCHLPGGRLDAGDQPGVALLREIREETGLTDVELILPCHASRWGFDEPVKYSVAYLARLKGTQQPVLPDAEDHMGFEWVAWQDAATREFIHPTLNRVVRDVLDVGRQMGVVS